MTDMPDTILIGTCRIKRMLAFMEDRQLKGRIKQISSHVHYAAEIKQVIEFIGGKDLPKDLLGLIIDDINVGKIGSLEELQEWRTETSKYLNNANKAIIEISSIKKYLLDEKRNIYGNITALNSILGSGTRLADFVPKETLQKRYQDLKPSLVSKEEIIARMGEIKKLLAGKQILWLSHFRFYIEEKGCEIEERLKLFEWISETAKEMGDDYFDQTIIVDTLGLQNALIDSSHYTQEAEKVMAKVISSWVVEGKIPDFGEKKKYFFKLESMSSQIEEKEAIVHKIKIFIANKQHSEAAKLYEKLIEIFPGNINYYFSLVGQLLLINKVEQAKIFLDTMGKIDNTNDLYILSNARFLYKIKNYDESFVCYKKLLKSKRFSSEAVDKTVSILFTIGEYQEIINILDQYGEKVLSTEKLNFYKGRYYYLQKEFLHARTYLWQAVADVPENETFSFWYLRTLLKLENFNNAVKYLGVAKQKTKNKKQKDRLMQLEQQINMLQYNTILIGTCRIKRMLAFMEDRQLKGRIKQISSHVHYAAEIKQVIEFIGGKDLPKDLLGLIIDDINVGKIGSLEELQEWRTETSKYLNNANKAIIEISSIKKYLLDEKRNIYGNITALNSILGSGTRLADFVPKETLQKRYQDLKPSLVSKEEIIARMGEIKKLLAGKQILWLSHFRFYIEEKGCEIEERLKLFEWISETAKEMGDDYFDQTIIVDTLGLQNALIDSSHYTQEAEKVMAKVISSWVVEGKIPDFGEKKKNSQRGSGTTAILKNQDGCIYNKDPQVTVFLLTVGSPQFKYTIKSITEQINKTDGFILKIIDHISPFSKACNMMIETCKTAYFIQLDEDMTLDDGALELMLDTMNQQVIKNPNVSQCVFRLRDKELGNILGVKIYNYEIVKNYYWENITSSDRIFNKKLKKDGYEIVIYGGKNDTVGTHAFYRTDFELFLKSATIGHKAKIQATSSDIKQFSMLPTSPTKSD